MGRASDGAAADSRSEPTVRELTDDDRFDALQNHRRREVIRYLRSREGPVDISNVTDHVAAREYDTTIEALSSSERKRVYVGLQQCHLPRLDGMDVVEFDPGRGLVSLGPTAPQLYEFLPRVDDDPVRPWELYYLGYAAASGVLLAGAVAVGLAAGPVEIGLAFSIVAALGVLAVAHALDARHRGSR